MIQVTRPFLPPIAEYEALIGQIWDSNWLTNNGPLLVDLKQKPKAYLGVEHLMMMTNGTVTCLPVFHLMTSSQQYQVIASLTNAMHHA